MSANGKEQIFYKLIKRIEALDPNHMVIKRVSRKGNQFFVEYVEDIRTEGDLRHVLEDLATACLVAELVNKHGYPKESLILEKKDPIATTATYKDCFVKKPEKHPSGKNICMICEVKVGRLSQKTQTKVIENQLLRVAHSYVNDPRAPYPKYLLYFQVCPTKDCLEFVVFTMDYEAYLYLPENERRDVGKVMENPLVTGRDIPGYAESWLDTYRELLRKGTDRDLVDIRDLQEINRNINAIKNLVWRGKRKPEKAFNFIVRLIIAKIYDEMFTKQGDEYRFQIRPEDKENLSRFTNRINEIYQNAQHHLAGIPLQDAREDDILIVEYEKGGPVKIEPPVLYEIVKHLQRFRLRSERNRIDVLGEFFERFIWTEYAQSAGQFFTHPNLVRFAVDMLDLPNRFLELLDEKSLPLLIDPSCGSGTFLVEAMKAVSENEECREKLATVAQSDQHWAQELLYGIDTERDLVLTAKTNMIMHGDGSGNIMEADALLDFREIPYLMKKLGERHLKDRTGESPVITKREFGAFAFVLSNPPFSIPLGEIDRETLSESFVLSEHYGAGKKSKKNGEVFRGEVVSAPARGRGDRGCFARVGL